MFLKIKRQYNIDSEAGITLLKVLVVLAIMVAVFPSSS